MGILSTDSRLIVKRPPHWWQQSTTVHFPSPAWAIRVQSKG